MKTVTPRKGAPTPAITRHPAIEKPSTSDGRSKKQRRRYTTANQRYLAVRSPRTRAINIGRRVKGRGYHSRIPKTLKKRWHRAIYMEREDTKIQCVSAEGCIEQTMCVILSFKSSESLRDLFCHHVTFYPSMTQDCPYFWQFCLKRRLTNNCFPMMSVHLFASCSFMHKYMLIKIMYQQSVWVCTFCCCCVDEKYIRGLP